MLPLSLQLYAKNFWREAEKFPIDDGRRPCNGLEAKAKLVRSLQLLKEERKLHPPEDDSIVKLLFARLSIWRNLKLPNVFGIRPEKELKLKSRIVSLEALVMELGIVPVSLFFAKENSSKFGSEWPIVDGRWSESWLLNRLMSDMVEILKMVGGMWKSSYTVFGSRETNEKVIENYKRKL